MTFVSARMVQGERLIALALAAFSAPRTGVEFSEPMPQVQPRDAIEPYPSGPPLPRFAANVEMRPVYETLPFTSAERSEVGGWIRLKEPHPLDYPLAAALTDAWFPAAFPRLTAPEALPTIDLTIHFRAELPLASFAPDDSVLALFRSRHARGGFVEEDGELWAPDGTLIAQSRQLAILQGISQT
jgi:acyl-CoA thioesterase